MTSLSKGSAINDNPPTADRIDQLIDSTGDGTGTTEQATTADEYMYKPGAGVVAIIERINIFMQTAGRITPGSYGNLTALTTGILITTKNSSDAIIHTFTPQLIKVTNHWGLLAGRDIIPSAFGAGVDNTNVRWTLSKAGAPVIINGDAGEYLSVNIQDDLSALTSQIMHLQAYKATQ